MKSRNLFAVLATTALLSMSVGYILAQEQQGLQQEVLAETDLEQHFQCMEGKILRMSRFEIEPAFVSPEHNHRGRPGVFYVLDGRVTEYQDGVSKSFGPGEGFVENDDITKQHRIENSGSGVATVIYTQIMDAQ